MKAVGGGSWINFAEACAVVMGIDSPSKKSLKKAIIQPTTLKIFSDS